MDLIFATNNKNKIKEVEKILGIKLIIPTSFHVEKIGKTYIENAILKINAINSDKSCFAEDSGLEVEMLNGAPGIFSAKYSNGGDNNALLLREMAGVEYTNNVLKQQDIFIKKINRNAVFKAVFALKYNNQIYTFTGELKGKIGHENKGNNGFAYDTIFIPDVIWNGTSYVENTKDLTLAELSEDVKNIISHRVVALNKMKDFLSTLNF